VHTTTTTVTAADRGLSIAPWVGSSQYRAFSDDALKDEDNAAWVMRLPPAVRQQWIDRIGWIRLVDRLAENQSIDPASGKFQTFCRGWQQLRSYGQIAAGPYESAFAAMKACGFADETGELSARVIAAWEAYLYAIADYNRPDLAIDSLDDYEAMLENLAGKFFQVLPFLSLRHWQGAGAFGVVDQFYNNLRDLKEDSEQGICYFPTQVLRRFGVDREEILHLCCFDNPGYHRMMAFWLEDFLPQLTARMQGFVAAEDLHESWEILRYWSLHRYSRIEQVFYWCGFDFSQFPDRYWPAVRRDLQRWQVTSVTSDQ